MIRKKTLKFAILPFFIALFIIVFFGVKGAFFRHAYSQEEYRQCVEQANNYFSKMHLYGWREAAALYEKAYKMNKTEEIRKQLFLALFLTAIREKDVKIMNPETYRRIQTLGDISKDEAPCRATNPDSILLDKKKLRYFSGIIDHYRTGFSMGRGMQRLRAEHRQHVDITVFDIKNSPLDLYLYLFCLNYYSFDFREQDEQLIKLMKRHDIFELIKKFSQSPLFIFFNIDMTIGKEVEIEKKYPQFAEYFQHHGNMEYERSNLVTASHYYEKALELIPDYTIARNGIGNIYYFTVQYYEKAIVCYARTLSTDSRNPVALFGQAVSLHHLEQYDISNMVLDFMLSQQELYHGEAYYYKAYNYYYMNNPEKAADLIKKAKTHIPGSGEVNYLSGLLHYKKGEMAEAELDFLRSLKDDSLPRGNSLFYLGKINLKARNWIFFDYFRDAVSSLNDGLEARQRYLQRIDSLRIQSQLKEWMKWNRKIRLKSFKESSREMIRQMNVVLEANKKNHNRKKSLPLHRAAVTGEINSLRQLVAEGANLDARDREGYTALHRAVLMGKKEAVKFLIEKGAAVNTELPSGYTPLHEAAYGGHKEIAAMLIEKGAAIYVEDDIGKTPLQLAAEQEHNELLLMLKPLHTAVEKGDQTSVCHMLDKEAHLLNVTDEKGRTPLYLSVVSGHKELARALIDRGAELDISEKDGSSLLGRVMQKGFKELAELLTARGVELSDRDILEKEIAPGEAVVWHIGSGAWAVKTRNHVLIFDHLPVRQLWRREPLLPFIALGEVNPGKLSGKKVSMFITHRRVGLPDINPVFEMGRYLRDVRYFIGWKPVDPGFHAMNHATLAVNHVIVGMNPGDTKHIDGVGVAAVRAVEYAPGTSAAAPRPDAKDGHAAPETEPARPGSAEDGVGFLIKVDGLTIYYAGNHANGDASMCPEFSHEIDRIAAREKNVDLLFITASAAENCPVNRGAAYAVEKLGPRMMFPIHAGGEAYYYKEFARQVKNKKSGTLICYAEAEGQRFFVR